MPNTLGKRGYTFFLFISLTLKHFSKNPCFFQKKSVSLQKQKAALGKKVESLKKEMDMDKKKNENFFLKLIEIKKEIRHCVQSGRDLKDVEKNYGISFSKPL